MIIYELHDDTMRQLLVPRTAKNSAGVKSGAIFFEYILYIIQKIHMKFHVMKLHIQHMALTYVI